MTATKVKMKKYPKGLDTSIQEWALGTIRACENQYVNKMDCATVFALCRLAEGDNFDFAAFRYKIDDKEALAIVTESMSIDGISLGMWSYIKYKDVETLCQTLVSSAGRNMGLELIALRTGENTRVYFEAVGIANALHWSTDVARSIADHRRWKADRMMQDWVSNLYRDYEDTNKLPSKKEMLAFVDEWSQYNDDVKSVQDVRDAVDSLDKKEIKKMFKRGSMAFSWGIQAYLLMFRHMNLHEDTNNG